MWRGRCHWFEGNKSPSIMNHIATLYVCKDLIIFTKKNAHGLLMYLLHVSDPFSSLQLHCEDVLTY